MSGLIACALGFGLNFTFLMLAHAQTSWCAVNCQVGTPTPEMRRLTREQQTRRARFEQKWGRNTDNYNDQRLERIERNPSDPDCWQYTPKHC